MVYPNSVVPLSLLLGASGMTVSAAATPSCSSQNLSVYMGREGCKRPTMARATPRGMDTSTARLNSGPDSSRLTGSASDIVGPTRPVNITTTKDVPRVMLPSKESDGLPIGGTERTTGWMDPQQKVYNVMDGYLDIVGASDEGPMTVKIASLGFPDDNTGRNPFELGPETELGSAIFLAPTDSPEASLAAPSSHVSNHTMATFDARSVPLGVFSTYNATSSSPSATTAPIAVRLKASVPVHDPATREDLCITYNNNYDQVEVGSPMYLQQCDDSYIPGTPYASRGSPETQLWQYDPVTHELKPLLSDMEAMDESGALVKSSWTSPSGATTASSAIMIVETAPPLPAATEPTTTESTAQGEAVTPTLIPPTSSRAPSHSIAQRDGHSGSVSQQSNPKHPKSPKPDPAIQKQGSLAPSLIAVPLVDPYNLVFTPKGSIADAPAKVYPPA